MAGSSDTGRSNIKLTGAVNADVGCGEILHVHVGLEPEWGDLDMGQCSGIDECDARMGQFLPQQQAAETQHPWLWPLCASSVTPGTRETSSASDNAQAFFVIFMPHILYTKS
jgi:hypothetical protein